MEALIDRRTAAELVKHFNAIQKHVPLRPIRTDADYDAAIAALNSLLDAGASDETHPLANLAATLGELIADYGDLGSVRRAWYRRYCGAGANSMFARSGRWLRAFPFPLPCSWAAEGLLPRPLVQDREFGLRFR
jgi:hypothetical protein